MRKNKKYSDVQNYLEQIKHINCRILSNTKLIEQLRDKSEKTTSTLKTDVVQSGSSQGFADAINKIIDLQFKISCDTYLLVETIRDITNRIDMMFDAYPELSNLLKLRYINDLSWVKICVAMKYEWAQTHRLHSKALGIFKDEYMPNKLNDDTQ